MDIHSSYFSFCIPSAGSVTITDGHVPVHSNGRPSKRVSMKNKPEILGMCGESVALDVSQIEEKFHERQSLTLSKMRDRPPSSTSNWITLNDVVITLNE
ncbi:hypothetical protein AVEN_134690-1 [Araneus ventricosus]|uniref:Uncharacterized protein n=1 Tax=Araneus ventricosus TaxID=182803 RepID=A0A4Y2HVD3_ARAVE|nr:hypothetical protein AVEN_134690-1 [Araneus ventricosus]